MSGETVENIAALIVGIGAVAVALGGTIGKIAQCLADLRRQTARTQSAAHRAEVTANDQTEAIGKLSDDIAGLSSVMLHHMNQSEQTLARQDQRLDKLESDLRYGPPHT